MQHEYDSKVAARLGTWKVHPLHFHELSLPLSPLPPHVIIPHHFQVARIFESVTSRPDKTFSAFVAYHESAPILNLVKEVPLTSS